MMHWLEAALLVIAGCVCARMCRQSDSKWTWLWISTYWAVLCVKNAMEVLHD